MGIKRHRTQHNNAQNQNQLLDTNRAKVKSIVNDFLVGAPAKDPSVFCQDLQAEHMNMRIMDCINCYVLMEEGPAHRLIAVLHPLGADQG